MELNSFDLIYLRVAVKNQLKFDRHYLRSVRTSDLDLQKIAIADVVRSRNILLKLKHLRNYVN